LLLVGVALDEQSATGLAHAIDVEREVCRDKVGVLAIVQYALHSLVGKVRLSSATRTNNPHATLGIQRPLVLLDLHAMCPFKFVQNSCRNEQIERII